MDILQKGEYFSIAERDIIEYGIKQGSKFIRSVIITLIIGIFFNIPIISGLFLISFIPLRKYAGGYHANTSFRCMIISALGLSSVFYMISKEIVVEYLLLIALISFGIIFILAPISNYKKKLDYTEILLYRKITRKILFFESACLIIFILLKINIVTLAIVSSFYLTSISLLAGYIKQKLFILNSK